MANAARVHEVDFAELEERLLAALYFHYFNYDDRYAALSWLRDAIGYGSLNPFRDVLSELREKGLITRGSVRRPKGYIALTGETEDVPSDEFRLTRSGINFVKTKLNVKRLVGELLLDDTASAPDVPSSDDEPWHPLNIDRSESKYEKMVAEVEKSLSVIEGDNGYAAKMPDERNGIVESIRGALLSIKKGAPSLEALRASLLKPLQYISEKFSGTMIGEAGKRASAAVLDWLSTFF
jgi:hypothetical protein